MKNFYLIAWFLMTIIFLALVITGYFSELSLFIFGLGALALLYSLALWSAYLNTRNATKTKG